MKAHAQKPDFVFRRSGRVHLKSAGTSVQSNAGSRGVRISGRNAGSTMFRGSEKSTGYPLHSPVSPSLPLPSVTMCYHISTGLYPLVSTSKFCLNRTLCEPQNLYGHCSGDLQHFLLPGIDPRFLRRPACSLVSIRTELPSILYLPCYVSLQQVQVYCIALCSATLTRRKANYRWGYAYRMRGVCR